MPWIGIGTEVPEIASHTCVRITPWSPVSPDSTCTSFSGNALLNLQDDPIKFTRGVVLSWLGYGNDSKGTLHPEDLGEVRYCPPFLPEAKCIRILASIRWDYVSRALLQFALEFLEIATDRGQLVDVDEDSGSNGKRIGLPHPKPSIGLNLPFSLRPKLVICGRSSGSLVINDYFEVWWKLWARRNNGIANSIARRDAVHLHIRQHVNNAVKLVAIRPQIGGSSRRKRRHVTSANDTFFR